MGAGNLRVTRHSSETRLPKSPRCPSEHLASFKPRQWKTTRADENDPARPTSAQVTDTRDTIYGSATTCRCMSGSGLRCATDLKVGVRCLQGESLTDRALEP